MKYKNAKPSTKIALCGIASALSVLIMVFTGIFPFSTIALPLFAGIILMVLVVELNAKTAFIAYIAVALLSIFMLPDKEAVMLFVVFFGYYPIIKTKIERIKFLIVRILIKTAAFNLCVIGGYWVLIILFKLNYLLDSLNEFGEYSLLIFLVFGNVIFWIYDFTVSKLSYAYIFHFRNRFVK